MKQIRNALQAEKSALEWVGGGHQFFSEKHFQLLFFFISAHCLVMFYICTTFHENLSRYGDLPRFFHRRAILAKS